MSCSTKATEQTRFQSLLSVLNDLEEKGVLYQLFGTTAAWKPVNGGGDDVDNNFDAPNDRSAENKRSSSAKRTISGMSIVHADASCRNVTSKMTSTHMKTTSVRSSEHEYQPPESCSQAVIARKRKNRGKMLCIRETAAVLRALQQKLDDMTHLRQDLLARSRNEPLPMKAPPRLLEEFCKRGSVLAPARLHLETFVQSDTIRLLVPFDLMDDSPYVDCTNAYARLIGRERDTVIRGLKVSEVFVRSTFIRFQQLAPIVAVHGPAYIRNLPAYVINKLCDVVLSVETETVSSGPRGARGDDSSDGRAAKKRPVRRFLHALITNFRPMHQRHIEQINSFPEVYDDSGSSHGSLVSSPAVSRGGSCSDLSDASLGSSLSMADYSQQIVPMDECLSVPIDDSTTASAAYTLADSCTDATAMNTCPAVFAEPLQQTVDAPLKELGWLSTWSGDQQGNGIPDPWVQVEGALARDFHTLFNVGTSDDTAPASMQDGCTAFDGSSYQDMAPATAVHDEAPSIVYHTLS